MKARLRRALTWIVLFGCWLCTDIHAADVRAWLDRSDMQLGETVTLNVEVAGDTNAAQPDWSALRQDFEMRGTQSSTSVNIVNGQASSKLLWAVGLEPKHDGTLTIPALEVAGKQTQPLTLQVHTASAAASGVRSDDIFVEAAAEPLTAYVQQQVQLTVKLYFALNLADGSLDEPQAEGLLVRKLGQDTNYTADVGGRRYRVLERHYALLPEKSGRMALSSIAFRGHAMDPGDVNSFFSRGRSVAARSAAITLDVRSRPAAAGNDAWLPAHALWLSADGIGPTTQARVGEPLTLTMHLKAQGLGYEQLPELQLPNIEGADVYPDKATTQNRDDGTWLFGERERKFAVVPNRPGTLSVPAISLDWWNTVSDRLETAQVQAMKLQVLPANAKAPVPPIAAAPVSGSAEVPAASITLPPVAPGLDAELRLWRILAWLALTLWTCTLAAWIVWLLAKRKRANPALALPQVHAPSGRAARAHFHDACKRSAWPAAAQALLTWARATDPDIRNLGELAHRLSDPAQTAAIGLLERACYGGNTAPDLGHRLNAAFSGELSTHQIGVAVPPPLPQLYAIGK